MPWRCGTVALLVCLAPAAFAAEAYVALAGPGGSVSQFRPIGGSPVKSFATPRGASDILLNADTSRLYVGTTTARIADIPAGSASLVAVMNPLTGATLAQFPMPSSVVKMVADATDDHLYATGTAAVTGEVQVMSLDLHTGLTAKTAVPGASPFSLYPIALSRDGGTLYVPVTHSIAIFNAHTLNFIGSMALASNGIVAPPLVTLDGRTLLAAGAGKVYAIDLASRTLAKTLPIATSAAAFGTALSPDGKTFFVSAGTLSAIEVASLTVRASAALGQTNPYRLGISPDGSRLFATDLTFGRTAVVDAATLAVRATLQSIAPPFGVAVLANGHALVLNENSNAMVRVDAQALAVTGGFPVGDAPGTPTLAAAKLFIPEVANVALQPRPLAPIAARPVNVGFITTNGAVTLAERVYVNSGSSVRVIDPTLERVTGSILLQTGSLGSALSIAASGDGQTLLASYVVLQIDGGPTDAGIIQLNTATGRQKKIHSPSIVPDRIVSNAAGTVAYGIGYYIRSQVGVWDTTNGVFVRSVTLPGNPSYVALGVSSDGNTLYLVDQQGKVDFVDAASMHVVATVPVGVGPSGIAVSADGTRALVTDAKSNSATVIDLIAMGAVGTVDLGAPSTGALFLD